MPLRKVTCDKEDSATRQEKEESKGGKGEEVKERMRLTSKTYSTKIMFREDDLHSYPNFQPYL